MASETPSEMRLAGDIVAQFRYLPEDDAAARIAHHIHMFWDPRMRARLREQVAAAGPDCDPVVARAVTLLEESAPRTAGRPGAAD